MSYKKQKVVNYSPNWKEWHPPGYNFNGPYSKVEERLSLNYTGNVGTSSYFIPVNRLDYTAFQHDLYYYSPDNLIKAYADDIYLKDFKNIKNELMHSVTYTKMLSATTIGSMMVGRLLKIPGQASIYIYKTYNGLIDSKNFLVKAFKSTTYAGKYFNPTTGIASPEKKKLALDLFGIKGAARGPHAKRYRRDIEKAVLTGLFFFGTGYFTKPIENIVELWNYLLTNIQVSEEWKAIQKENNLVMDKYKTYLDIIGKFDENHDFVVKNDIDESKAKKAYEEFYKQFGKYISFVNKNYDAYDGFKTIETPELNKSKLDIVASPVVIPPPDVKISKEINEQFEDIKKNIEDKTLTELNDEITKVLKKIQTLPYTSKREDIEDTKEDIEEDTKEEDTKQSKLWTLDITYGEDTPPQKPTITPDEKEIKQSKLWTLDITYGED